MNEYIPKIIVYLICFVITLYGLSAFDFNRFIKQGRTTQALVLYYVIAFVMTYILGQFMMSIILYFN